MERADILYNILLNSNIKQIDNLCNTNAQALQYCQSEHFWKSKFMHDRLPRIKDVTNNWEYGYRAVSKAVTYAHNIITISLLKIDRDSKVPIDTNIDEANDGTIVISIDILKDYHLWFLPGEIIDMITKQLDMEEFGDSDILPNNVTFVASNNDHYDMVYEVYVVDFDECFYATISVTIDEMRDILVRACYQSFLMKCITVTDKSEYPYIPEIRDININDLHYRHIKRYFTRLGILDSLTYLSRK